MLPVSLLDHLIVLRMPGAPCRVGSPGPQPGASVAGRSGAALIRVPRITRQRMRSYRRTGSDQPSPQPVKRSRRPRHRTSIRSDTLSHRIHCSSDGCRRTTRTRPGQFGSDPGGAGASRWNLATNSVGVRTRPEVTYGRHLCPAPFPGRVGASSAAARIVHPADVRAREADLDPGSAAATGRGARSGRSRSASAPQLVGTGSRIRSQVTDRPGAGLRDRAAGRNARRHPRLRRRCSAR